MKRWLPWFLLLTLWLAACGEKEVLTTPTPFGSGQITVVAASQPTAVPLADLLAEPESFQGQFVQLSGLYEQLPLLVCSSEPHPGPATWALLESEENVVAVSGFDVPLRALLDEGTPITVNGYWRFWEGPVGCGKQAVPRQFWYLNAIEMVSPEQLARITGVPAATSMPGEGGEGETAVPTTQPITPTVPITGTESPPMAATPTGEPIASPTLNLPPTLPPTIAATSAATATADGSPSAGTPTVTITGTPGIVTPGPSPTLAGTPGTPTVTPQPGTYTVIVVDAINPDDGMYGWDTLAAWQKQNWPLTLNESTAITIGVAAGPTINLALAVYDEQDNLLMEQNNAPAGQLEQIVGLPVNPDNAYTVQVYDANGLTGNYFLTIVGNQTEDKLSSRGILQYNNTRQDRLAEFVRHFWYFYGEAGDVIDVTAVTGSDEIILISLYDENADVLFDDNGDALEYVEGEILDFTLPATGLYLIWLEELVFDPASYTLTLTGN